MNKCKEGAKKLVSFCAYVCVSVQQQNAKVMESVTVYGLRELLLWVPVPNPLWWGAVGSEVGVFMQIELIKLSFTPNSFTKTSKFIQTTKFSKSLRVF